MAKTRQLLLAITLSALCFGVGLYLFSGMQPRRPSASVAMTQVRNAKADEHLESVQSFSKDDAYVALRGGDVKTLQTIESSCPPIFKEIAPTCERNIIDAANAGRRDLVRYLVSRPRWSGDNRGAPLFKCCGLKSDAAMLLIQEGIDVDETEEMTGWSPLLKTILNGRTNLARAILEKAKVFDKPDKFIRKTPLANAAEMGNYEIAKALIAKGAFVDAADTFGMTPLLYASMNGKRSIVKLLLDSGASVNAQSGGLTSLSFARCGGHEEVARLLREAGGIETVPTR